MREFLCGNFKHVAPPHTFPHNIRKLYAASNRNMTGLIISTKEHPNNQGCRFGGWMEQGGGDRQTGILPWA